MHRVSLLKVLALNTYWVGLSFMWNSLHVLILPSVLLHLVPENQKNTYLGLLTFVGLIIAMLVQPISGALSDRWVSRWGRRRPLILLGTLFDFVFLALLGWAGGIAWMAIGYIGLQFTSNIAHGPAQGLLPDVVPEKQLGWASGFKNFLDMAGLIASSLLMGRMLDPQTRQPVKEIGVIALVLAAGAAVTILGVREKPVMTRSKESESWNTFRDAFHIDLHKNNSFAWLIASRLLFLIGIYGIQSFIQYYVRDVLAVENPVKLTGDLLAAITLALIAFAIAGGWLGDRFGHKRMSLVSSIVAGFGCVLLLWARTPQTLLIFGGVVGIGIGMFLTANWALANQLAPLESAGKFMGLTNLATAGAAAIGRLEGPMIDFLNNASPGAWWGYTTLFLLAAVCILSSSALLGKIRV